MTAFDAFVKAGAKAIVIAGTGNGNVSDALLPDLSKLVGKTILVRSPRTGTGSLCRGASYDGDTKNGFIAVDDQPPVKARPLTALVELMSPLLKTSMARFLKVLQDHFSSRDCSVPAECRQLNRFCLHSPLEVVASELNGQRGVSIGGVAVKWVMHH